MSRYDLRECMGTVLRDHFSFDRLDGIRKAYGSAFGNAPNIDKMITDKALDSLSAVRNLIVHRATVVDAEYSRRAKYLPIPNAPIGARITLNGDNVMGLVRGAFSAANGLLAAVDEWLTQNPSSVVSG